jgi:hypothetical protein
MRRRSSDALSYTITDQPDHGSLSGSGSVRTYTPNLNYNGNDSFKFQAKDRKRTSNIATVSISVVAVNDGPSVSASNNGPVDEGGSAEITATATDPDTPGSSFSYSFDCDGDDAFEVGPQTDNTTNCSFDDSGERTVNVRVTDGNGGEDTGSTTVVVNNISPTATLGNNGPVDEGSSATVSFSNQDDPSNADTSAGFRYEYNCDGSNFTTDPDYASASTSDSTSCTFGDDGTHTVRARIMDKDDGATEYTTDVDVSNVDPSVTAPADQNANEGEEKSFDLGSFADPGSDGDWTVTIDWGDGSTDDKFTKSAPGSLGSLSHTYADDDSDQNDGENDNDPYTVTVTVAEDGGAPSDSATFQVTVANVALTVTLSGADAADEGDKKSYTYTVTDPGDDPNPTITTSCGAGAAKSNETANSFDCTFPDGDGANGTDYTVSVSADDGEDTGTDTKTVTVANLAPTADGKQLTIDEDETTSVTLSGTDPAGASDPLTFSVTSLPTHGKLYKGNSTDPNDEITNADLPVALSGTNVTYVPDADYNGSDSFGFEACDDSSVCDDATVDITLNALNDAPVVDLNGGAADGIDTTRSFTEDGGPVALAPDAEVSDADDTELESAEITLTNRPDGNAESLSVDTSGTSITASSYDSSMGILALSGTASLADYQKVLRTAKYDNSSSTPDTTGRTVEFTANDGQDESSVATTTVSVAAADDAPVAVNDSAKVDEDSEATAIDVLTNDTDVDGGSKTITEVTQPTNGTVVITNGGADLTYAPNSNYCNDPPGTSPDTFTYKLNGGSQATVSMKVTCVNDNPVADDETFNGANGAVGNTSLVVNDPSDGPPSVTGPKKSIAGDILDGDTDVDGPNQLAVQAGTFTTNDGGSVTIEADGDFTYVNDPADACTDTSDFFDYTVTDGNLPTAGTDTGRVNISISGCVWYVSNNASGNAGTSAAPFDTLAQAQTASATGHSIFVFDGDNTTTGYGAGIDLKANQKLIGEAANLVVGSDTLHTGDPTKRPTITDSNADVVALDDANEVRGLEVDPSGTGGGIAGAHGRHGRRDHRRCADQRHRHRRHAAGTRARLDHRHVQHLEPGREQLRDRRAAAQHHHACQRRERGLRPRRPDLDPEQRQSGPERQRNLRRPGEPGDEHVRRHHGHGFGHGRREHVQHHRHHDVRRRYMYGPESYDHVGLRCGVRPEQCRHGRPE